MVEIGVGVGVQGLTSAVLPHPPVSVTLVCGCWDHVVKWWMSVWVLRSCCEVVDVSVGVKIML